MGNQIKTVLLLGAMTGFFILVGGMAGGRQGIVIAFVLAVVMNFFSYWFSDKIVLAMYKAKEVTEAQAPDLYRIVASLTQKAGMPMPKVYIIPGQSPNAFATGRNPAHAAVAVTEGMLKLANSAELEGVLAHELTHVKNRDTLICAIAATVAGAIMVLASMARWSAIFGGFGGRGDNRQGNNIVGLLFMAILAPFAAMLIQMAISRSREYLADDGAADLTGNPNGLASALGKLSAYSQRIPLSANPSTAHLFIVNPLSAQRISRFFSTHPPIEERIERLRKKTGMLA